MKNKFQCNFNGVRMGGGSIEHPLSIHSASIGTRWKPRGMQLICTLVLLFTFAIGNVWAEDVTWEGPHGNFVSKKLSDGKTEVTITKDASNSSKTISCISSSKQQYLSINGGGKYLKFTAPDGYTITNIKLIWMSGAASQAMPILFGKSISAVGTVEGKDKSVTITNGGFTTTGVIATSGATNCNSEDDIAIPAGMKEVLIGRNGSYSSANYTKGTVAGTVKVRLDGTSGDYFKDVITNTTGSTTYIGRVVLTVEPACTAPTDPAITGTTAYDEGDDISLTATAASGITGSTTYAWYKGDTWDAASAGSSIGSTATLTINTCATTDAGTYWCKISNGTCFVTPSSAITVEASAAPEHNITYSNTKGAANTNPATYKEGIGVTSFAPLADVADFHFTGWNPASISDTEDQNVEVEAQWVDAYNVTFSASTGSGTAPAGFQKWQGAKFNLPGQGSMVAPSGKAFDGWKANGAGNKLAAGIEYTMGDDDVEFVAQWKNVPVVLFHYQQANLSGNLAAGTYDAIGGTLTTSAAMSKESAAYNAAVPNDLKGGANVSKLGSNAAYIQLTLTTGKFKEGDTVYICGYNPYKISSTAELTADIAASFTTGTAKGDYNIGYAIIPEGIEQSSIYLSRAEGNGTGFAAVKVIRPAAKEVVLTVNTLTDVKVNGTSISAANLASLVSEHNLALSDGAAAAAPTITFNKHTVITYDDNSEKETDTPIEVTATVVEGKWSANTTIDAVTYTVTLVKLESYEVSFDKNGGEGNMNAVSYAAGAAVTLPACTFEAPNGKEFDKWISDDVTITSGTFNMPASDVTVKASWKDITYAVTYHANGATGTVPAVADYAANAEVTVLGKGDLARQIETEAATFYGWNTKADMSGTRYEADAKFNMPAADVDLYAVWGYALEYNLDGGTINDANYATWYYSDGATSSITTALPSDVTKDDYTFVGWYTHNGLGEKVTSVNAGFYGAFAGEWALKAVWKPSYASSINIEQWVLDNRKDNSAFRALMATKGYTLNNVNDLDSLDDSPGKSNRNYAYLGQKLKAAGASISFTLKAGKTVKVRIGNVGADFKIYVGETATTYTADDLRNTKPTDSKVYTYTATEDIDIKIENVTKDKTLVIKQIMIDDDIAPITLPYKVIYNFNDGETPTTNTVTWIGSALSLPDATAPEDYTFAGWYDELLGGELVGAAGASYTPTDNVTLFAHYAPVEYAVAYDGNGATSGSMSASAAGWGTLVTPAVNAFEKTGNIFAGWVITKTSDGSATGITFSEGKFEMPKYAVTLVAQWEDVSKVAIVVETNEKFESLAEAIDAATDGQTVQLIQDIEQADGVAIAKNLILDLNDKTFTCTSGSNVNSRAIKITDGDVTVKNGTIAAVTTANFEGGCYGAFRIEGATANVTLRDLTMTNGRHYGLGIKLVNGHLDMEDCTVTSINGAGGLEVGTGTALVTNCTFTQSGFESAHAWIATCLATCYMGNLEVQGGTYTSEHYVLYVYSSGGAMDVKSGTFEGDIRTAMDLNSYPTAEGSIEIEGGSFQGVGGAEINFAATTDKDEIAISAGTFNTPIENQYCAEGYVPSAEVAPGVYTVVPKDGVEIIGVVVTGNTEGTVSGLYKGTATVNLNNKKIDSGKYIYVTLKEGYTFEENDVLIVDVNAKSNLDGGNKALEITTGVGNIDGDVWKSIAFDDYTTGENIISLEGIAAGQTSIGLKRSANQNAKINGLRVLRPMMPELTAITINGRDGEIDPQDDKHFNVTIPYEADLANLTIVPTIAWNAPAAENSIVVNDGGAWVEGNNTYKLTDKDGDYTIYTLTLTRDVLKHTVSFNTHGGSAVASELVVDGEKLAAAPADPTREDYLFLGWAEAAEGEVVDVTDIVINADKTFYAQWKYENPIVILDENGDIDHDNFFTGMGKGTINFGGADHNCISFGSTASTIVGATGSNKFIVYNAKTTQTRIKFVLYNTQSSAKNIVLQKVAEGETAPTNVVIEVPSQQQFTTEYYAYNSDENRSMYVYTENTGIKVLQVKVIESGTPIHQAGQAGYVLNLNKGRVFAPSNEDVEFEGLSMKVSSNYKALNSEVLQTQNNLSFKVDELVTMTLVSTGAKYQVSKDPAGSGKEYAAGTNKHTLTQGTWYIVSSTSSNMKFTNISFEEPVADHTRDNLNPSFLGTLCWTNDAILGGATLYEFAGKDEHNYLVFDEVEENRLEAGKPYIFMPENGNTEIKVYNIDESDPMTESQLQPVNNVYGTLDGKTLVPGVDDNMYYFSSNHIWAVKDFTVNIPILPNRCYIDYPAVLAAEPAPTTPAPGRRRVTMGVQGSQIATGVGEIEASETPMKVMIDGQLFIIRGEKMFDATGRLVK